MLLRTRMMSVTNTVPSIFQTLSPCCLKVQTSALGLLILARLKSWQVKVTTIKELIFLYF
jgi:hypothetical protein